MAIAIQLQIWIIDTQLIKLVIRQLNLMQVQGERQGCHIQPPVLMWTDPIPPGQGYGL